MLQTVKQTYSDITQQSSLNGAKIDFNKYDKSFKLLKSIYEGVKKLSSLPPEEIEEKLKTIDSALKNAVGDKPTDTQIETTVTT